MPADSPRPSKVRPGPGLSGSGALGETLPIHQQILPGSKTMAMLVRRRSRSRAGQVGCCWQTPMLPFARPETKLLKNSRTSTVAETTIWWRRTFAGRFQAVQSQEMARSAAHAGAPISRLAIVAGRPAPGEPRHPHAPQSGLPRSQRLLLGQPFVMVSAPADLPDHGQAGKCHHVGGILAKDPPLGDHAEATARTRKFNIGLARLVRAFTKGRSRIATSRRRIFWCILIAWTATIS